MYKLCRTEQSSARQKKLEKGLLETMQTQRYEEISVSDLCDRLNIPRKSFYRYFSGKDGALYALIDHTILEHESTLFNLNGRESKMRRKEMERFFLFWKKQKPLLDALHRSGLTEVLVRRTVNHALEDAGSSIRVLLQDNRTAAECAMTFVVCGLMALVLKWHESGFEMPLDQIAAISTELVTKPLLIPELP